MAFELPSLNYTYDALEPHFDALSMEIHHSKHHNTYITNANAALAGTDYESSYCELVESISGLPDSLKTAVRNNAGGHANHSFFWSILSPEGGGKPVGKLAAAIDAASVVSMLLKRLCKGSRHSIWLRLGMAYSHTGWESCESAPLQTKTTLA